MKGATGIPRALVCAVTGLEEGGAVSCGQDSDGIGLLVIGKGVVELAIAMRMYLAGRIENSLFGFGVGHGWTV